MASPGSRRRVTATRRRTGCRGPGRRAKARRPAKGRSLPIYWHGREVRHRTAGGVGLLSSLALLIPEIAGPRGRQQAGWFVDLQRALDRLRECHGVATRLRGWCVPAHGVPREEEPSPSPSTVGGITAGPKSGLSNTFRKSFQALPTLSVLAGSGRGVCGTGTSDIQATKFALARTSTLANQLSDWMGIRGRISRRKARNGQRRSWIRNPKSRRRPSHKA